MPKKRRRLIRAGKPPFSVTQILVWVDAFHHKWGHWPKCGSGRIDGTLGETWCAVAVALQQGLRGLPRGSSLVQLLEKHRGYRSLYHLPPLKVHDIVAWADAYKGRTGRWPKGDSGPIDGTGGETWGAVGAALQNGNRGLPPGGSLSQVLAEHRGYRHRNYLPRLRVHDIVAWADAHKRRTGEWPTGFSGPVAESPGENWNIIDLTLQRGKRGLRGGSSLAKLLAAHRGRTHGHEHPRLTIEQILAWAEAQHTLTGYWPTRSTGPIGSTGETWLAIDSALRVGRRGLPGGSSLFRLLKLHGKISGNQTPYRQPNRRPAGMGLS